MSEKQEISTQTKTDSLEKAISEAIQYGIDVSLLDNNLELSPQMRIERHESALMLFDELKRAGDELSKA